MKAYKYFDRVMTAFVAVLIVSNIASSAKIIDLGIRLFSVSLAFDGGTLLFPISYVFGDVLTEVYGFRRSRRVIWTGFFALALTAAVFGLIGALPGEATWRTYAGDSAYQAVLGGISSGGIVVASLSGYWLGEFFNSIVLAKMKILTAGRWLWMRTIGSTLIGEALDTLVFIAVASAFGVFPWSLFPALVLTNYILKVGIEVLLTPLTYAVVSALKRVENEDYYDRDTDFNPFISE